MLSLELCPPCTSTLASLMHGIRSGRAFKMAILKCISRVFQPEKFRIFFMNFAVLMLVQIKSLGRHEN